jgi:hypothetical protein
MASLNPPTLTQSQCMLGRMQSEPAVARVRACICDDEGFLSLVAPDLTPNLVAHLSEACASIRPLQTARAMAMVKPYSEMTL